MKILILSIALVACTHGLVVNQDGHSYKTNSLHEIDEEMYKEGMELQSLLGFDEKEYKENLLKTEDSLTHVKVFYKFMMEFNKTYSSYTEYNNRYSIFRDNMKKILELQQNEKGSAQYGPTKYSDLTEEEFSQLLGLRMDMKPVFNLMNPAAIPDVYLPQEFDWRTKGAVTPVKNQGQCGSCWAFSTTGNIEGQYAIKHEKLLSFSEQELVDCDWHDGGCQGGIPERAYYSIRMLGGLETESEYPYNGVKGKCNLNNTDAKVKVLGGHEIPQNEKAIAKWLVKNGPVSVAVNANPMQFYRSGVLHPFNKMCDPKGLNHAVLIVGYGFHTTKYQGRQQPYWIIKNTWGADWGEEGYVRLYRGNGVCGVNLMPTSAIIE